MSVIRSDTVEIRWDVEESPLGKVNKEAQKFQSTVTKAVGSSETKFDSLTKKVKKTEEGFKGAKKGGEKLRDAIKNIDKQTLSNITGKLTALEKKLGGGVVTAAKTAAKAIAAIGVGGAVGSFKLADMASDLSETQNKVLQSFSIKDASGNIVDDSAAKAVEAWSKNSITQMGLAQQTALDMTALFGDMGTSMGIAQGDAANMSMNLTQLGADLASFKNMDIAEVTTALNGVFTGETESLKRLGVVMTQTNLENYALAKGIKTPLDEMSEADKVMLRYDYLLEKTANAQGDFARTGGGFANQLRMAKEQLKQIGTTLGGVFIGGYEKALSKINSFGAELNSKMTEVLADGFQFDDVSKIAPLLGPVGTVIQSASDKIQAFTSDSQKMQLVKDIFNGIKTAAENAAKFAGDLASRIWDFVSSTGFLETVKSVVEGISKAIGWVKDNFDLILSIVAPLAAGFAAAALTIQAISAAIKIWSAVQWVLNSGLLACPITWIVLGIAALVAIIVVLVMHWDTVKAAAINCWNKIKEIWGIAAAWVNTNVITPLKNFFTNAWYFIVGVFAYIWQGLCAVFGPIASWVNSNVIQPVVSFFKGLWDSITEVVNSVWSTICEVWGVISGWVNENIITPVSNFFSGMMDSIGTAVSGVKKAITGAFQEAWDTVTGLWQGIVGFFSGLWDSIKDIVGNIISKGKEATGAANNAGGGGGRKMAYGGFSHGPERILWGEAGPEVIIPLSANKRQRGLSLWEQAGRILGAAPTVAPTVSLPSYTPSSSVSNSTVSNSQTNTYSPQFTLNLSGTVDRTTERTVKQWVQEALAEAIDGMARTNPRISEV